MIDRRVTDLIDIRENVQGIRKDCGNRVGALKRDREAKDRAVIRGEIEQENLKDQYLVWLNAEGIKEDKITPEVMASWLYLQTGNLLETTEPSPPEEFWGRWFGRFHSMEKDMDREIATWGDGDKVIEAIASVKGIANFMAIKFASKIDIKRSDTIQALWRYCGFGLHNVQKEIHYILPRLVPVNGTNGETYPVRVLDLYEKEGAKTLYPFRTIMTRHDKEALRDQTGIDLDYYMAFEWFEAMEPLPSNHVDITPYLIGHEQGPIPLERGTGRWPIPFVTQERDRPVAGQPLVYNSKLKAIVYNIGVSFLKSKSPYAQVYYDQKERYQTDPRWMHRTPKHIHMAASRKMVKLWLSHVWLVWRELEGLPVTEPYIFQVDGEHHKNYISPEEMGWTY